MLAKLLFLALPLLNMVYATTYTPNRYLIIGSEPNGIFAYMYNSGSLLELASSGAITNPIGLNTWVVNRNATAMAGLGIVNVAPSTNLAGFGYVSPTTSAVVQRLFYQTTNGNLVTAVHTGLSGDPAWRVDSTPIATNLPLGTVISAFWDSRPVTIPEILVVHYADANGVINQRWTTDDAASSWSAPIIVTTTP